MVLQGPDIIATERGYCPSGWDCADAITTDISHSTNRSHSQVHQPPLTTKLSSKTSAHGDVLHTSESQRKANQLRHNLPDPDRTNGSKIRPESETYKEEAENEIWRPMDGCTETFRYRHETRLYTEDDNPGKRLPYRIPDCIETFSTLVDMREHMRSRDMDQLGDKRTLPTTFRAVKALTHSH